MFCHLNPFYTLGIVNSVIGEYFLSILNPTLNYLVNDILSIPFFEDESDLKEKVITEVKEEISISKTDWDSFETSWDFKKHPLI